MNDRGLHFLTILLLGLSASLWAVMSAKLLIPLFWLLLLSGFVLRLHPAEFPRFLRRLVKIGVTLLFISLLQIIFRRQGTVLLQLRGFPLIFSTGLREAVLLWIRFLILFALAFIMARVSPFHFLLFSRKAGLSADFSLRLLTSLRLIPEIYQEARRGLWFLRFRGIRFGSLSLLDKILSLRQLLYGLLMRSMNTLFHTSLLLELRGYGRRGSGPIPLPYPLGPADYFCIILLLLGNAAAFRLYNLTY